MTFAFTIALTIDTVQGPTVLAQSTSLTLLARASPTPTACAHAGEPRGCGFGSDSGTDSGFTRALFRSPGQHSGHPGSVPEAPGHRSGGPGQEQLSARS